MTFRGIKFYNRWNECYANESINALLACNGITSAILQRPNHCRSCVFLYNMMTSTPGSVQYSTLLREWACEFNDQFIFGKQNDPAEFIQTIIQNCDVLMNLTKFEVQLTSTCNHCGKDSSVIDTRNIFVES